MADNKITNYVVYKGHPIVLCENNTMAYGDVSKKAFAEMLLFTGDASGPIMVTIKATSAGNAALRNGELKNGLYEALEYAYEFIEFFNKK